MTSDQMEDLIWEMYHVLLNHPPHPESELFKARQKVLAEAYDLIGHRDEPYLIPEGR